MRHAITVVGIPVIFLWLLSLSCASPLLPAGGGEPGACSMLSTLEGAPDKIRPESTGRHPSPDDWLRTTLVSPARLTGSTPQVDGCRAGKTCAVSGEAPAHRIDDKRREPKPGNGDDKKREPKSDENKDDDDTLGSCLGILDCISGGLDMIAGISELFGRDDKPEPAKSWEKGSFEGPDEFVTFEGVIEPMNPLTEKVEIWSVAGGSTSGGEVLSEIPRGTKLRVVGRSYRLNNYWLCVCPTHRDDLYGWIREENLKVIPGSETGNQEAPDQ